MSRIKRVTKSRLLRVNDPVESILELLNVVPVMTCARRELPFWQILYKQEITAKISVESLLWFRIRKKWWFIDRYFYPWKKLMNSKYGLLLLPETDTVKQGILILVQQCCQLTCGLGKINIAIYVRERQRQRER